MEWKSNVSVTKGDSYVIADGTHEKKASKEDEYIIAAMEKGICDDEKLLQVIMEQEQYTEMIARLRLAEFVVEYGDYIAPIQRHMKIEM
ncbi:MAG: hypothetical protein PHC41_06115 [Lachnospiraceae bacterium]|nr:hypothetical protein [Lachnospiraceae bacterium]MDD3615786.1 hypothetical protein [Lachnospiraceae bacterium]